MRCNFDRSEISPKEKLEQKGGLQKMALDIEVRLGLVRLSSVRFSSGLCISRSVSRG